MRKYLIAVLCLMAANAQAAPIAYSMVKEKSQLKFIALQNNAPVTGKFEDFTATISFDYDRPQDGKITAEIKTGSVTTDYEEVEKNLKLPEWLATEKFPVATFETTLISKVPSTFDYYAEGKLTIKGKSVPVVLNFHVKKYEDTAIAEGFATIRRNEFEIGQGEWAKDDVIKNEVRIEFRITAKQQ